MLLKLRLIRHWYIGSGKFAFFDSSRTAGVAELIVLKLMTWEDLKEYRECETSDDSVQVLVVDPQLANRNCMKRMIIVCGPTGAGKTTYSISLSKEIGAIRFSIDPWMQTLFADDMKSLDYSWMIERVHRCYEQIWDTCDKIFSVDGSVVLDLGFTEKKQRDLFAERAVALNIDPEVHYLDAPLDVRKERVMLRNVEKDPNVYAFDVTDVMLDFMEPRFEPPDDMELKNGLRVNAQ